MYIEKITSDDMTLTYDGLTIQKNIYEQEIDRLKNRIHDLLKDDTEYKLENERGKEYDNAKTPDYKGRKK